MFEYTGDEAFRTSVSIPEGVDTVDIAVPAISLQRLQDNAQYLKRHLMGTSSIELPIAKCGVSQGTTLGQERWGYDVTSSNPGGWVQGSITGNLRVHFELDAPAGTTITSVSANVMGAWASNVHAALPASMPQLTMQEIDSGGNASTILSAVTDSSATKAAYEASHSIDATGLSITTVAGRRYFVTVTGESGANSVAQALVVRGISVAKTDP
jgi:hypothetical protein